MALWRFLPHQVLAVVAEYFAAPYPPLASLSVLLISGHSLGAHVAAEVLRLVNQSADRAEEDGLISAVGFCLPYLSRPRKEYASLSVVNVAYDVVSRFVWLLFFFFFVLVSICFGGRGLACDAPMVPWFTRLIPPLNLHTLALTWMSSCRISCRWWSDNAPLCTVYPPCCSRFNQLTHPLVSVVSCFAFS